MNTPARRAPKPRLTIEGFLQLPEEDEYRLELVRGQVVREPSPGARHGEVQILLVLPCTST